jgi:hypothetical protein
MAFVREPTVIIEFDSVEDVVFAAYILTSHSCAQDINSGPCHDVDGRRASPVLAQHDPC